MSKVLIIPDIHGRSFWKDVDSSKYDLTIFLGDYVDPYPEDKISPDDVIRNLEDLVLFKKDNPNTIFLSGNHDEMYVNDEYASYFSYKDRHDYAHATEIRNLLNQLSMQYVYVLDKYLFTHAGFNNKFDKHIKHQIQKEIQTRDLARVSFYRGGRNDFGSILWSDIREIANSDPNKYLSKYIQIFGHTRVKELVHHDNWYCLDCSKPFELNLETGLICDAS